MKEFRRIGRMFEANRLQSFEEFSGILSEDLPVLRFERQLRIGRIPSQLETLGDLVRNVATFNPFPRVVIYPGGKAEPNRDEYPVRKLLEGLGLRQMILNQGLGRTTAWISQRSGGNANRAVQRLSDFVPADPAGFELPNLLARFQRSISRQLISVSKSQADQPPPSRHHWSIQ